jgi:hypothetical protein
VQANVFIAFPSDTKVGANYINPPPNLLYVTASGGSVIVRDNYASGGWVGFSVARSCTADTVWSRNIASNNGIGFMLTGCGGFGRGPDGVSNATAASYDAAWLAFENECGVVVETQRVAGVIAVSNGVGAQTQSGRYWPSVSAAIPASRQSRSYVFESLEDSLIVGHSGFTGFDECTDWLKPRQKYASVGGLGLGYQSPGSDYAYTGFAIGANLRSLKGVHHARTHESAFQTLDRVEFAGFSGKDACGRQNVAITNELAGAGQERYPSRGVPNEAGVGSSWQQTFGSRECLPLVTTGLTWTGVPDGGKLRFSTSYRGDTGYELGYSHCYIYDDDGSLLGAPGIAMADVKRKWPTRMVDDCKDFVNNDYHLVGDNEHTECPWWLRMSEFALKGAFNPALQGSFTAARDGYASAECVDKAWSLGEDNDNVLVPNRVLSCTNMDPTFVMFDLKTLVVSGSIVKYGPMGVATNRQVNVGTSRMYGETTSTAVYKQASSSVDTLGNEENLEPHYFMAPNRGWYRLLFTGDICPMMHVGLMVRPLCLRAAAPHPRPLTQPHPLPPGIHAALGSCAARSPVLGRACCDHRCASSLSGSSAVLERRPAGVAQVPRPSDQAHRPSRHVLPKPVHGNHNVRGFGKRHCWHRTPQGRQSHDGTCRVFRTLLHGQQRRPGFGTFSILPWSRRRRRAVVVPALTAPSSPRRIRVSRSRPVSARIGIPTAGRS